MYMYVYMYISIMSMNLFRICSDVVTGVVTKCLGARPKTKEGGILLCLMFVEIEQHAVVQVRDEQCLLINTFLSLGKFLY